MQRDELEILFLARELGHVLRVWMVCLGFAACFLTDFRYRTRLYEYV